MNNCLYIFSQKRRRARREKRRQKREEQERNRKEHEENRPPVHTEKDGVIHVETHHPRSSIIIIKSNDDDGPPKNLNTESSFVLPSEKTNVLADHNKNQQSNTDHNDNKINDMKLDNLNVTYGERTLYVDKSVEDESGSHENYIHCENHSAAGTRQSEGDCFLEDIDKKDKNNYSGNTNNRNDINYGYHDDMEDSSSDEEENMESEPYESCLKQLYPEPLSGKFEW